MSTASIRRSPLVIAGDHLSSGGRSATFAAGSVESLLRSYLTLVRELRGQRREPGIELRTEDVRVLAAHLGVSDQLVLGGLLDLMGATRAQRSAMAAMLAAGALTLVLTGSLVSDLSAPGVSAGMAQLSDAVATTTQADRTVTHPHAAPSVAARTAAGPATTASADDGAATAEQVAATPTADVLRSAARDTATHRSVTPVDTSEHPGASAPVAGEPVEPVDLAITPDGALVASVAPPVPQQPGPEAGSATAELPDGTTVGVATPPVPAPVPAPEPDDRTATTELPDGTTVGVATPPVPAPVPAPDDRTATTELPDGTTVGVAAPPVPSTG